MNMKEALRHIAEHARQLVGAHGGVSAKSWEHSLKPVTIKLPGIVGKFTGAGVFTALVGRYSKNALARAELRKCVRQQESHFLRRNIGFDAPSGAKKTHASDPTFLSPGA